MIYLYIINQQQMENLNYYDSPVAYISIDEDGIFLVKLKETTHSFDSKEISKQLTFILKHRKGDSHKIILDTRGSLAVPTDSAIQHFIENNFPENKYAIVVNNLPMKLMMKHLLIINKFKNVRLFKSPELAHYWILED